MTSVDVRPATVADVPDLCRLYLAFHEFHVAGVPERLKGLGSGAEFDAAELTRSLQEILNNPQACLLVADANGTLVGFAEIYLCADEPDPARMAYVYGHLQSLMVDAGWRERGLGKRLVRAAEAWAAKEGASEVRLDTWAFPGDPVAFYERMGYRPAKRLPNSPSAATFGTCLNSSLQENWSWVAALSMAAARWGSWWPTAWPRP